MRALEHFTRFGSVFIAAHFFFLPRNFQSRKYMMLVCLEIRAFMYSDPISVQTICINICSAILESPTQCNIYLPSGQKVIVVVLVQYLSSKWIHSQNYTLF